VVEFIDSPPIDVKKVEVNFFDLMSLLSQIHRKKSTHSLWSVYYDPDRPCALPLNYNNNSLR
uniref:hypothetical protein n=1 Tax=Clostridium sp. E02 TaxID=2487134 RepID=UPI0019CF7B2E